MSDEVTLVQLTAEVTQLRRQLEIVMQRLDMIYGAVARLAESQNPPAASPPEQPQPSQPAGSTSASGMALTPEAMLDPGAMLDSLRQYAVNMGLDVSQETVDRLKSHEGSDKQER